MRNSSRCSYERPRQNPVLVHGPHSHILLESNTGSMQAQPFNTNAGLHKFN
jgi:hypothetical protein